MPVHHSKRSRKVSRFSLYLSRFLLCSSVAFADDVPPSEVIISSDLTVENPLSPEPGDPFRGLEVFIDRKLGNCVACHVNFDVEAMQFLGDVGPELNWIGDNYSEAELRAILVDASAVFGEQTIMPSFYAINHGERVREKFAGKPILNAQQIEDVVAYLSSLSNANTFEGAD